ncbi:MAG: DNA translocase FtsK, partial [Turicibacter sanguinis]
MIFSRKVPTFFTTRQIGYYLMFIAFISFSHLPVYREFNAHNTPLLSGMVNYYWNNDVLNTTFTVGGGFIGSVIYGIFVPLMTAIGLYILSLVILCYGTLLVFNLTFKDVYEGIKLSRLEYREKRMKKVKKATKPKVKKRSDQEEIEEEAEELNAMIDTTTPIFDFENDEVTITTFDQEVELQEEGEE